MNPTPVDRRTADLALYRILDTPPEAAFDDIAALAAAIFDAPVATIGFLDGGRIWFKARIGLEDREVVAAPGLCASAVHADGPYVVGDAASDPRTRRHPLVTGDFGLRFYAAVPIAGEGGGTLGTLCVIDRKPRRPSEEQILALRHLGGLVEELLRLRLARIEQQERRNSQIEMAESIPHMVWTATAEGTVDYVSDEYRRITGMHDVALTPNGWLQAVHPGDHERTRLAWSEAVTSGQTYNTEFRLHHAASGAYRWHVVAARPHRDAEGHVLKWYGSAIDIHDRKEAEEALRRNEERLRTIVENEPECVKLVSPDRVLLEMNPAGLRLIEADSREEAVGREIGRLVHPDDRDAFFDQHRKALAGESSQAIFRVIGLKGTQRWMESHAAPLRGADGAVEAVLSVTRDITKRRRTESALIEALKLNALILESAADGLHGVDADGRIIFENAAALRMLGYEEHEIIGREAHPLIHHHRADGTPYPPEECPMRQTRIDGRTRRVDSEVFFRKDGTSFPVEYTVAAMVDTATGQSSGTVVGFRDVTEEKREAKLRALETRVLDMVSGGSALVDILYEIAHTVDRLLPEVRSSILLVDETGRLRHGATPHLPDTFNQTAESFPIGEGLGSCGTAAWRREQVIVADIRTDPLWAPFREFAARHDLRACFSTPVLDAEERVLATFALYYREPGTPSPRDQLLVARIAQYVRVAVERIRQLEELQRSEERFRSLYGIVPVSIWEEDWSNVIAMIDGLREQGVTDFEAYFQSNPDLVEEALQAVRVLDVNDTTLRMFEADTKDDILDSLRSVFARPGTIPGFIEVLVGLAEGKTVHEMEMSLSTVRGRPIHVLSNTLFPPAGSRSGRVLVSRMDITARREAEELFRIVAQATSDVVWDWNLVTDTIWWNDGLKARFGYRPDHGMTAFPSWSDEIHPEDRERVLAALMAAVDGGGSHWEEEYRFRRADGSYAHVVDQGTIIRDETGRAVRMAGSIVDVTELRALEDQLRRSQRLDAVGQLTGGVAHDFNNLLTVILGNAEMLAESLPGEGPLRALAEMTAKAAERGAELTDRLLAFARRQPLDPKATDINRQIAGMDGLLRRTLGEHVEIQMARAAGLWKAMVDPGQLESAILNLCLNARDAMPEGGRLTIETANVHLDATYAAHEDEVEPGPYVLVAVSDTGCGMDAATLKRAFEPFFTTKEVGKGSGLGLSMVYGFVKQSNGHVRIYAEPGEGTTLKLYLPRAEDGEAMREADPDEAAMQTGCEKIILVEDDDMVRDFVSAQLASLGYNVVAARNGPEAVAALERTADFDLLFTDVVMPGGMSGRQLAEAAHALRPELPVLFTSGYAESAIVHHGRLDPGVHLLHKPYRRQELAAKVRAALDRGAGRNGG